MIGLFDLKIIGNKRPINTKGIIGQFSLLNKLDLSCYDLNEYIKEKERIPSLTLLSNPCSESSLVDISFVKGMRNLTRLSLNNNSIIDMTPVEHLQKLLRLELSNNKIKDITGATVTSPLEKLYLNNNEITEISDNLASWKRLRTLNLGFNDIQDFGSSISQLQHLEEVHLYDTNLKNLVPLKGLSYLSSLNIGHNKGISLVDLHEFKLLYHLHVNVVGEVDFRHITSLDRLSSLGLDYNKVTNFDREFADGIYFYSDHMTEYISP